jgi:hypothetical protein
MERGPILSGSTAPSLRFHVDVPPGRLYEVGPHSQGSSALVAFLCRDVPVERLLTFEYLVAPRWSNRDH